MMQAVAPFEEIVTIAPKPKMVQFRKRLVVVQWIVFIANFVMVLIELMLHMGMVALGNALSCLLLAVVIRVLKNQTNRPQVKPIILLTPDGLTVDGIPPLGAIPWDAVAAVKPGSFLFIPMVRITPRHWGDLRAQLGQGGNYMWMYWLPGGSICISCIPFSLSANDLAAKIDRYRQQFMPL